MTKRDKKSTVSDLLTVQEVADQLRLERGCVYAMIATGKLRALRVGSGRGSYRVTQSALAEYLDAAAVAPDFPPPRLRQRVGPVALSILRLPARK